MKNKRHVLFSFIVLCLYLLPVVTLGEQIRVPIIDNLDSSFVWHVILAHNENITGPLTSTVPQIMDGLPRDCLGSELNFEFLLFRLFSPITAYIINIFSIHLVAFFGMYLLLSRHVIKEEEDNLIACGAALCFSLLPYWPPGELSIAGMPLALYAFLNIRDRSSSYKDWGIICLLPFYSNFEWAFCFFLVAVGTIWLFDYVHSKKVNIQFLSAICLMAGIFLIVDYRLIYDMFFNSNFISHRKEFNSMPYATDFIGSIKKSFDMFIHGDIYTNSLQTFILFPSVVLSFILVFSEFLSKKLKSLDLDSSIIITAFTACVAISLFYGIWQWQPIISIRNDVTILRTFNFTRFTWLSPLIWYVMFAVALKHISKYGGNGKRLVVLLLLLQVGFAFTFSDDAYQSGGLGLLNNDQQLTYDQYFSPGLFSEIRDYIGEPQSSYRIVNIGIDPMVDAYNGFYTLDSYQNNYPLEYKHEFRKLIAGELDKNTEIRNYFDFWGSRCYVFTSDFGLNYVIFKGNSRPIDIDFNTTQFKKMGGKYVFSACKIKNSDKLGLELMRVFQRADSPWKILVYKVK